MSSSELKKDLLLEGSNRYNKIRHRARTVAFNHFKEKKCCKCLYDKHVEVCHIKSIKDFPMDALINEINAINNLELLCPNCHWEKDYLEKKKANLIKCKDCGKQIWKKSIRCKRCARFTMAESKTKRPAKEELESVINEFPFTVLGKKYGVSDRSVRKWCNYYKINIGTRLGFWAKKKCQEKNGGPTGLG